MHEDIKKEIFHRIRSYDKIILSRHIRPDGDAMGSALGLKALLRASFPEKEIISVGDDSATYLAFMGADDPMPSEDFFREALLIQLDTSTKDRISNSLFDLAKDYVLIDHHEEGEAFIPLRWVEPDRSSCCEMIVDFYRSFASELHMTREAATLLYTGMVTDSGRFRFPSVTADTLRLAALLLEQKPDTEILHAHLSLKTLDILRYEAYVYEHVNLTPGGVAWLYVDKAMQERFGLSQEDASNSISYLSEIKNSLIWLAFIDDTSEEGKIRVRLRSRFVTVRELATHYRGGGHDRASGATVYSWEEARQLIDEADRLLTEFKETHEGWL